MPRYGSNIRTLSLQPPLGGVARRWAYQQQGPFTTIAANNVWPLDSLTGRQRISTRPGITATGASIGTPYNWCEATYVNSGVKRAVGVTTANGTYISTDGATFTEFITTNPGTNFASCDVYQQVLYQAAAGAATRAKSLTGSAGAGDTLASLQTVGTAPSGNAIVQACMSRIFFGGDPANPHKIYSPRLGTPTDWEYAPEIPDQGMAWQSGGSNQQIRDPITALFNHGVNCLLVGGQDSLSVISGNPTAGGQVYQTGSMIGPLMQSAMCKDLRNNSWMATRAGVAMIPAGCPDKNFSPILVSPEALALDLVAIRPEDGDSVSICCDVRWNLLHVYVNYNSGTDKAWVFDLREGGGWWQMSFSSTMQLGCVLKGIASTTKSSLLAINSSGTVYQFDSASTETVASYCMYGPIKLADDHGEGKLAEYQATLAENSGSVKPTFYTGDSPQEVANAALADSGGLFIENLTRDVGPPVRSFQYAQHPQMSGNALIVKLEGASDADWGIEEAGVLKIVHYGRRRVGVA